MGEPIALVSSAHFEQFGKPSVLQLDNVETRLLAVPDDWQLGNRMLVDISFAERLLQKQGKLSYIAVFDASREHFDRWLAIIGSQAQWIENTQSSDLASLTDSFHLNLTAMSMLAFLVGLFIAYNGVKYSLLKKTQTLGTVAASGRDLEHGVFCSVDRARDNGITGLTAWVCTRNAAQSLASSNRCTDLRAALWSNVVTRYMALELVTPSTANHVSRCTQCVLASLQGKCSAATFYTQWILRATRTTKYDSFIYFSSDTDFSCCHWLMAK